MKIHTLIKIALIGMAVLFLSGCFGTSWIITLKGDGSGTIEMEYRIDKQFLEMMQSMGSEGETAAASSADLIDEQEMRRMASALGEGVRFVSAEAGDDAGASFGYTAIFEFDDINNLKIDPMMGAPEDDSEVEAEEEEAPFVFQFSPGRTAELRVLIEQDEDESSAEEGESAEIDLAEEENPQEEEMMMGMMKPYFRSMSFLVQVVIDGEIRETDATYLDGNTITLLDMDMEKIVDNDELFSRVINSEDMHAEEMVQRLEEAGIKIEGKDLVSVKFR